MKTTLDGGFLKEVMEKYFEHYNSNKREKLEVPMLTSSSDKLYSYNNNNEKSNAITNTNNDFLNYNIDCNKGKALLSLNKNSEEINLKSHANNQDCPQLSDDKMNNIFLSPNPFALEEINYTHSNIFSSPKYNRNENFLSFNRIPEEENKNNENNLITMNTFNLSRNSSMDMNEIYKNGNKLMEEDMSKKVTEQNFAFDDSYFSVSSDKNKN
jgi:hypothetical protein